MRLYWVRKNNAGDLELCHHNGMSLRANVGMYATKDEAVMKYQEKLDSQFEAHEKAVNSLHLEQYKLHELLSPGD